MAKIIEPKIEEVPVVEQGFTVSGYCDLKGYGKRERFVAKELFKADVKTEAEWTSLFKQYGIVD